MRYNIRIAVERKKGVADPEGKTIFEALGRLGYEKLESVKVAKLFNVVINAQDQNEAKSMAEEISERVLSNPVIETFTILSISETGDGGNE